MVISRKRFCQSKKKRFIHLKARFWGGLFRNRNSWNDQNNSSFSGLSWLQTCQNHLTVSLWRFYSHSGMRVAKERTIVWLIPTYYSYSGIGPKERTLNGMPQWNALKIRIFSRKCSCAFVEFALTLTLGLLHCWWIFFTFSSNWFQLRFVLD